MRRALNTVAAAAIALTLLVGVTGCTRVRLQDRPETRTQTLEKTVALDGATRLSTEISMGVGELKLAGTDTTATAMTGSFVYAPPSWLPEIAYAVSESTGTLSVRQPARTEVNAFDNVQNTWDIKIARGVPTDLKLQLGVGESRVDLRGVDVTSLNAVTGVGATAIDLSGPRTSDLSARIESGVGELTLRLPRSVGARVTSQSEGIGDIIADGVRVNASGWVNDAYSGGGPKIDIVLHRGIGDVKIILVD